MPDQAWERTARKRQRWGGEHEALKGANGGAIGRKGADAEVGWCVFVCVCGGGGVGGALLGLNSGD